MKSPSSPAATAALLALAGSPLCAQELYRTWTGEVPGDDFGTAIAVGGDLDGDRIPDLAIGAPGYDGDRGRVYVVSAGTGRLLFRFDGAEEDSLFGHSVAMADVNGDGVDDVIASAPATVFSSEALPRVRAHSGVDGSLLGLWTSELNGFGDRIAAADLTGDGRADVLISVRIERGWVFLYSGADGSLIARIEPPPQSETFGASLEIVGDVDGDGTPDIAIGDDEIGNDAGAVHLFSGAELAWVRTWIGEPEARIGGDLAGAGDVDQDGFDDVLIGAPSYGEPEFEPGRAFLYSGGTGELIRFWEGSRDAAGLGGAVAGVGDVDGDSVPDVLLGSFQGSVDRAGEAFVHSSATGELLCRHAATTRFGDYASVVAGAGDVDLDGVPDVLLGEPSALGGGRVSLYTRLLTPTLSLEQGPLVAGGETEFVVRGARAGERVWVLRGRPSETPDVCLIQAGGVCLSLSPSLAIVGQAVADATGEATLLATLPEDIATGEVGTQAAAIRGIEERASVVSNRVIATLPDP